MQEILLHPDRESIRLALRTALVVGTLLSLINYAHKWFPYRMDSSDWARMLLCYVVPFAVSSYTSWRQRNIRCPEAKARK